MKIIMLLIPLCLMMNCNPVSSNRAVLSDNENRITVILDTLNNGYYWQIVPTDLMGRVPTKADHEAEREAYPFRAERDSYLHELDSLFKTNKLSENLLIDLLHKDLTENVMGYISNHVVNQLFDYHSDDSYVALYEFLKEHPSYDNIAVRLVENGQYKDEIRTLVFQMATDENIDYLAPFFHLFDTRTDKQFCSRIIEYINSQIGVDTQKAHQAGLLIAHGYFRMHYEYFDNEETRALMEEYDQSKTTEDRNRIRDKYNRAWIKNLLQYYKIHENE